MSLKLRQELKYFKGNGEIIAKMMQQCINEKLYSILLVCNEFQKTTTDI